MTTIEAITRIYWLQIVKSQQKSCFNAKTDRQKKKIEHFKKTKKTEL